MADLANVALVITSCGGSISTILVAVARFRGHDDDDDFDDDDYERRARKLERRAERIRKENHHHRNEDDDLGLSFTRWAWRMT